MEREPTLKKALEPYLEGLERDINYDPKGGNISALFLAVLYSTKQGSFSPLEEDRKYAKRVVEILLDYGADPTRHEGDNPQYSTPLSAAKILNESGRDPEGIYELLLKHSINSATEGAAFENKFTDVAKKLGNGIVKAIKGVGGLGRKGLEGVINVAGNVAGKVASSTLGNRDNKDLETVRSGIPDSREVKNKNKTKPSQKNLGEKYSSLPESAKKRFIYENLPDLVVDDKTNDSVKMKITELLLKSVSPYSTDLYTSMSNLLKVTAGPTKDTKVWSILLNPKYRGIDKILRNTTGLSSNYNDLLGQISFIAYYISNGLKLNQLKDGSSWKSLKEMDLAFKSNSSGDSQIGKDLILSALNRRGKTLSKEDAIKFISSKVFKGDTEKARKIVDKYKDRLGRILSKKFTKNFDDDNLLDQLIEEISELGKPELLSRGFLDEIDRQMTGRQIILSSIGSKSQNLSKGDGIKYLANKLFGGDNDRANEFFDTNRAAVTKLLNREYEKTFEEDNLEDLLVGELKTLVSKNKNSGETKKSQLNEEQEQAALALQSLGYSKTESFKMVKGKNGDSSAIVYNALKSAGSRGNK